MGYEYEYRHRISYSGCDINNSLSLISLIDMFQDASIFQSEDAGVGIDFLRQSKLLWVLSYWEIEINKLPKLCDEVFVGTYPYGFKGFLGYRNFYLKDSKGEYLVKANTTWTMIDTVKMLPAKAPESVISAYAMGPKLDMMYSSRKILLPRDENVECVNAGIRTVGLHQLDGNMHVNNCRYIEMALAAIEEVVLGTNDIMSDIADKDSLRPISRLRTDYRQQAHLNDKIFPVVYFCDKTYTVSLNNEEQKPYSVVSITFK
ncbi:MAG: acyl-[acyl-carrier-protein] thioesterase [Lachnospiraceae bacterium]|nr:acyl-[acyl-carrier-protein] thioesterase [Lachnospiraceae bacterium]